MAVQYVNPKPTYLSYFIPLFVNLTPTATRLDMKVGSVWTCTSSRGIWWCSLLETWWKLSTCARSSTNTCAVHRVAALVLSLWVTHLLSVVVLQVILKISNLLVDVAA